MKAYRLKVGDRFTRSGKLESLVKLYNKARDNSNEGASTWPDGFLYDKDKLIARISYNGRLWEPVAWDMNPKEYQVRDGKLIEERLEY
jgi:hypothetical protein